MGQKSNQLNKTRPVQNRIKRRVLQATKPARGTVNMGSTCFLNATLQCLLAIEEIHKTKDTKTKARTTQDQLSICIMELQKTAPAYIPSPLIQHFPHLIHYAKGEQADAH